MEEEKIDVEEDPVLMEEREAAKKVVKGTRYSSLYSPKYATTRKKAGTTYSPKY